jgi:tRNA nucleotidyltransferase/poly(A) polymerase
MAITARDAALEVAQRLHDAGYVAYFAGGCVRDRLRGEEPKDYDVATDAAPQSVRTLFPAAIGVGAAFGVMLVRRHRHSVEVATFRSDGSYSDGRHPDAIRFGDPRADALRRDFTINGLFEDPRRGTIIDYVGGQADLKSGLIRAIGDPLARLNEDRLRALRAVRFAARFGYLIDPLTRHAVQVTGDLRGVSRERIGQELRRMLADPGRGAAVQALHRLGLDRAVLGEDARPAIPTPRVQGLPAAARFEAALAAWLLDRRCAAADPAVAAEVVTLRRWGAALVLSNDELALVSAILGHIKEFEQLAGAAALPWRAQPRARRKRFASSAGFAEALAILAATDGESAKSVAADVTLLATDAGGLAPPPLVTGADLISVLRLPPGPAFKRLLREVYDAQLEGLITSREEALSHLRAALSEGGPSTPFGGAGVRSP